MSKKIDEEESYLAVTKKYNTDKIVHSIKKENIFSMCMTPETKNN